MVLGSERQSWEPSENRQQVTVWPRPKLFIGLKQIRNTQFGKTKKTPHPPQTWVRMMAVTA